MQYIDSIFFSQSVVIRILIGVAVLSCISIYAHLKKQLTVSGIVAAFLVGFIHIYIGGPSALLMMMFFFLSCAVIAKLIPDKSGRIHKKGAQRDMAQVFANSLPAVAGLFIYRLTPYKDIGLITFASSLAEAISDTWAGDIGIISRKDPVSILTFTKVPKGLSGGISILGCGASLMASFLMSLLFVGCYSMDLVVISIVTISGTLGALFDSFLGATLQVHYRRKDGSLTEHEYTDGERNEQVRGLKFMNNDMVNLCSGIFSFLLSLFLAMAL